MLFLFYSPNPMGWEANAKINNSNNVQSVLLLLLATSQGVELGMGRPAENRKHGLAVLTKNRTVDRFWFRFRFQLQAFVVLKDSNTPRARACLGC